MNILLHDQKVVILYLRLRLAYLREFWDDM